VRGAAKQLVWQKAFHARFGAVLIMKDFGKAKAFGRM